MSTVPVIAIFDIGKTNKKVLVFDQSYKVLHEHSDTLPETVDDDGYPCEDVHLLTSWLKEQWSSVIRDKKWDLKATNVSGYGASFVHLDTSGKVVGPLYNYLKPLPEELRKSFHAAYPGIWARTASPDLDNLNSGLQLYMIRHAKPELFTRIQTSLHLPQYLAYALNGKACSDLPSLGCHTAMWDFSINDYAHWVEAEGLVSRQAPICAANSIVEIRREDKIMYSGIGLHDSSAALIPYLATRREPFCLLSTGTWSITLNPFNEDPLTEAELNQDCLCYLSFQGKAVKASRLFSGHFHDEQIQVLGDRFNKAADYYKTLSAESLRSHLKSKKSRDLTRRFEVFDATVFSDYESAYTFLIEGLVARQIASTGLVMSSQIKDIFVDGGFSSNSMFMELLAKAFPNHCVYAANVAQASALGAAIAIHSAWNPKPISPNLLTLRRYNP